MLVFIDTETGGLDPQRNSLLSIALAVYNPETEMVLAKTELLVRNEPYCLSAKALEVNGINIPEHHQRSYKPKQVIEMIEEFLYPFYKNVQAKLAGHNAPFDIGYLKMMFIQEQQLELYNKLFSHRAIDTIPIAQFLKDTGKLPLKSIGLSDLIKYFGIELSGDRHTALADCLATVELYKKLCEAVR